MCCLCLFSWLSRPQLTTCQHHHISRPQHCHSYRQRLYQHPSPAQRTPCGRGHVHQWTAPLFHPKPHGCRHPTTGLHRGAAVYRFTTSMSLLSLSLSIYNHMKLFYFCAAYLKWMVVFDQPCVSLSFFLFFLSSSFVQCYIT